MPFDLLITRFNGEYGIYLSLSYGLFVFVLVGFAVKTWREGKRVQSSVLAKQEER